MKDPSTLVWAYTPVEDPAVYANVFKPFTDHLGSCTGKRIVYYPVQSNSAEIEAMRSGRLHFAGFSTGPTGFAVNLAGAVPFAAKGTAKEVRGYNLHRHRQGVEPLTRSSPTSRTRRSRIPRRRRTPAISRRACCFRRLGLKPGRGLQAADVGRT